MRNYFEICDELEKVNKEFNNNEDSSKTDYYMNKIEELEKEQKQALKVMANEYAKKLKANDEAYKKIDFSKEPLFLMNYCRSAIWFGKLTRCLNTDDFGYGEWDKEIPSEWVKEAEEKGNKDSALQKYFNVMQTLEDLFSRLCYFHTDISERFPEQRLYIRLPVDKQIEKVCCETDLPCNCSDVIEMRYVVGQGSDFSIDLVDSEVLKKESNPFIIDWEDAIEVSKMNTFEQAEWYYNYLIKKDFDFTLFVINKEKIFFLLGQASAKVGFVDKINFNNYKEVLSVN